MNNELEAYELELAYLAGLFDGEGCVSLILRKRENNIYKARTLIFTNSDYDICKLFKSTLLVGSVYNRGISVNKVIYDWRVNNRYAIIAANKLLPYLRIKKQQVIDKILTD